jgi:hypothetical protein
MLALLCVLLAPPPAWADWTATGSFTYSDRLYDTLGFNGTEDRPVREADIHIIDANTMEVLASGATNQQGAFSLLVSDNQVRTVAVRVLASTTQTPPLLFSVLDDSLSSLPVYSYRDASADVASHSPTASVNFGLMAMPPAIGDPAQVDWSSQVFNLFDMGIILADWVQSVEGSRPSAPFSIGWNPFNQRGNSFYSSGDNRFSCSDDDGYDDPNILHELGHFVEDEFGNTDNPGGTHFLGDSDQDPRLAWSEGWATFVANAALIRAGRPRPDIYSDRNSFAATGGGGFSYTLEAPAVSGSASERAVNGALYDLLDGPDTLDATPGEDDDPLSGLEGDIWAIQRRFRTLNPAATQMEDFWDEWTEQRPDLVDTTRSVFAEHKIEFFPDAQEPNDTSATATRLAIDGDWTPNTFYRTGADPAGDEDWFKFIAIANVYYRIEVDGSVGNVFGRPDPQMHLIDIESGRVIASADDPHDDILNTPSSSSAQDMAETVPSILWRASQTKDHYILLRHASRRLNLGGRYGSYRVRVRQISDLQAAATVEKVAAQKAKPGETYPILVLGQNFATSAKLEFVSSRLRAVETRWISTDILAARVQVQPNAANGLQAFRVVNPGAPPSTQEGFLEVQLSAQPPIIISELDPDSPDRVELLNIGSTQANLGGWHLRSLSPTFSTPAFILPDFLLEPGASVVISEEAGANSATEIFDNGDLFNWDWTATSVVDLNLLDADQRHVDYVRFTRGPVAPHQPAIGDGLWTQPEILGPPAGFTLSRAWTGATAIPRTRQGLGPAAPTLTGPASARENALDAFEENDSAGEAVILSRNGSWTDLAISPRPATGSPDADWFAFPIRAGDAVEFFVSAPASGDGQLLVVFPPGSTSEFLGFAFTENGRASFLLDAAATAQAGGGLYRLRITGVFGATGPYALDAISPLPDELPAGMSVR